ncbi:MAG: sigma-70 family RNA polymerase sigma factor [Phycisphaerae bacterium]|nr:sigma-70 family RNA polymerase sigma factor [Phycisphaerae bacterium]
MAVGVEELTQRAVAGDRVALGRLLMLYDQRLRRRVGLRFNANLRQSVSVEDVLQETYTAAYTHVRKFEPRGEGTFYRWLAAIADRKLLDAAKAQRAAKRSPRAGGRRIATDRSTSLLGLARLLDSKGKSPSGVVSQREAVQAMQVALAALPEPCRQAVWMRHIDGKAACEVAAAMGRTERAVHQLCYRALKLLREQMGNPSDLGSGLG